MNGSAQHASPLWPGAVHGSGEAPVSFAAAWAILVCRRRKRHSSTSLAPCRAEVVGLSVLLLNAKFCGLLALAGIPWAVYAQARACGREEEFFLLDTCFHPDQGGTRGSSPLTWNSNPFEVGYTKRVPGSSSSPVGLTGVACALIMQVLIFPL